MKRVKQVFLGLSVVFFLLALAMQAASYLKPLNLLVSRQVKSPDYVIIISIVMMIISIITWFAGIFLTKLQGSDTKLESGSGDWLVGILILIRIIIKTPLRLNLLFLGFLIYLVASSLLNPTVPNEINSRLKIFGAVCSALNLHALILLSASPQGEGEDQQADKPRST